MKFKGIEVTGKFELRQFDDYFEIYQNGNKIYVESNKGFWAIREFDENGKENYYENRYGFINDNRPKKTHKVFRLWKFLEEKTMSSKSIAVSILMGWPIESEGKTEKEAHSILHDNWLVEEEVE